MRPKIHLVVPMSGQGVRYQQAGYQEPKPLIPVNGTPMIERLMASFPSEWPTHFVLADNHKPTALPGFLRTLRPGAKLSFIGPHKKGPTFAVEHILHQLPAHEPVLISYCDYGLVWDARQFERFVEQSGCDACVISYRGFHAHYLNPVTYAYSRMEGENVVEVKEKGSFTANRENEFASCGAYYFKSAAILKEAIRAQRSLGLSLHGELYTSLTVQALIKSNSSADVRIFEIPGFFQWGTPSDLQNFEYWERSWQSANRRIRHRETVKQVLLPMAGLGSRFKSVFREPKPFIEWSGSKMFEKALRSLPRAERTVVVTLKSVKKKIDPHRLQGKVSIVALDKTPQGQALTVLKGLSKLHLNQEVLITACDHAITMGTDVWKRFHAKPDCDAAIFTMTGYPGASRTPLSYSYVDSIPGSEFGIVRTVSVKKPIKSDPKDDAVLVGTFWFRSVELLERQIREFLKRGKRVNGEFYLDSVLRSMVVNGLRVRNIPLEGYIGWGDPQALAEALYWEEQFLAHRLDRRPRFPGVGKDV